MIHNRSVPVDILLPHIYYEKLLDAVFWLTKNFGFVEVYRYGEPVAGVQMKLGGAYFMLSGLRPDRETPARVGHGTQALTVFLDNVDAHFEKTKSSGARIVEQLNETCYGERQYCVLDHEGHYWIFSQHVRDVKPDEWGAVLAK